jgi:hypothetical protein
LRVVIRKKARRAMNPEAHPIRTSLKPDAAPQGNAAVPWTRYLQVNGCLALFFRRMADVPTAFARAGLS